MDSPVFTFDEAQRRDLDRIVQNCVAKNWDAIFQDLLTRVQQSLTAWSDAISRTSTANDVLQLRRLAMLVLEPDPSLFLLRKRTFELPFSLIALMQSRALQKAEQDQAFSLMATDLRAWAKSAKANELVPLLRSCLIEGGERVPGRKRPSGRRSAGRFEPMVLGRGRGLTGIQKIRGGRRADDDLRLLISFLAVDWLLSTGLQPTKGRSDKTPFGALVFMVFQWIGEEDKAAHSLRTYWYPSKPRTKKKKPAVALSQG
jgi:hypothetical protein